jgi:hypothetical protein
MQDDLINIEILKIAFEIQKRSNTSNDSNMELENLISIFSVLRKVIYGFY